VTLASPESAEALKARGVDAFRRSRFAEALALFDHAIALRPADAEAHFRRAMALYALERFREAAAGYSRVISLDPNIPNAYFNRAICLEDEERFEDALEDYDRAITLNPAYAEAFHNRGRLRQALRQLAAARADFDEALRLRPGAPDILLSKASLLLIAGDLAAGWPLYESRWAMPVHADDLRSFTQPQWTPGEPLAGRTILLHCEQGFGDAIQFCRYAPLVAARGGRVILEARPALRTLFASLGGVARLISRGDEIPPFDLHAPLMSLPLALRTTLDTIPAPARYLAADPVRIARWARRLGDRPGPRIGIAWSGNPNVRSLRNRHLPLDRLLAALPQGPEYVSLQKDVLASDSEALAAAPWLKHFGAELTDFANTAALAEQMDLIVTVDTSAAHLGGALGRPTWLMLPFVSEWRWLLERDDSPWYPSLTLYRQPAIGDWETVLARVARDLSARFSL
jgi:Tfp pilus assembly protein PilF